LHAYLHDPVEQRPALVWEPTYQAYRRDQSGHGAAAPVFVMSELDADVLVLLPGPYARCGPQISAAREP
jgi:hypothetical protein